VAYAVARRQLEIGIRVALGATARSVVQLVLARMTAIVAIGIIAGLMLALVAGHVLTNVVYLATLNDPVVFGGSVIVMLLVGIVACWVPTTPVAAHRSGNRTTFRIATWKEMSMRRMRATLLRLARMLSRNRSDRELMGELDGVLQNPRTV
jgi:hypothetical protein